MATVPDTKALGELLRSRRERLTPAEVGLPEGRRRRTPGLRREEVALLASVSATYYTFLEQGRPVRPSRPVLDALASALRMSPAERRYLLVLANADGGTHEPAPPEQVDPALSALVARMNPFPTIVKGRRWDVLVANDAARELFDDWHGDARPEPNLVRWMFSSDRARTVYIDWPGEARAMLGRFRLAAAKHSDDPEFVDLIEQLLETGEDARTWWAGHDVRDIGNGTKKLRHPTLGPTDYTHVVLHSADNPDQTLVTYTPARGAEPRA
ncbi:MAG TPA: helix-turn-helix transcriptional regulator [Gaiellaceae bacterium]|nr:helix-turn-helix transcriptional regulator [Gaiellaceae bacterium]